VEVRDGIDLRRLPEVEPGPLALHAYTLGYKRFFTDPEVPLSRQTASTLGIPHTLHMADDWAEPLPGLAKALPEWVHSPQSPFPLSPDFDLADVYFPPVARLARVALAGWDGDALLYGNAWASLRRAILRGDLPRIFHDLGAFAWAGVLHRRPPRTGLRGALRRALARRKPDPLEGYPSELLDPDFQERHALRDRWLAAMRSPTNRARDPRAAARATLEGPVWSGLFQAYDSGFTQQPVETRHPLMDLRLVRFLLGLPVIPWCVEKGILRAYLRTRLPPAIWRRTKQGLGGDPMVLRLQELPSDEVRASFHIGPDDPVRRFAAREDDLGDLVTRSLKPGKESIATLYSATRIHSINRWLKRLSDAPVP
jgi:asparagine synthase (glutamine-hydrolysing)